MPLLKTKEQDIIRIDIAREIAPFIAARDRVRTLLSKDRHARHIVLDVSGVHFISRTAADELLKIVNGWKRQGKNVQWKGVSQPVGNMLRAIRKDFLG